MKIKEVQLANIDCCTSLTERKEKDKVAILGAQGIQYRFCLKNFK